MNDPPGVLLVDPDSARSTRYAAALAEIAHPLFAALSFDAAKTVLMRATPSLLITQLRLEEENGIHLCLWGRAHVAHLRCLVIGESDPALEGEATRAGLVFLRHGDIAAVVQAVREALSRDAPRRRWLRPRVDPPLRAEVEGTRVRVIDVGYGGIQFEMPAHRLIELQSRFELALPGYDVRVPARLRWVGSSVEAGVSAYGAAVDDDESSAGSRWREVVDDVSSGDGR